MLKKLAHFLLVIPLGCLDYQEAYVAQSNTANYYPYIDKNFVLPEPSANEQVFLGANCKKHFTVPPVKDFNQDDRLYFLWFFDGAPLGGPRAIEPENRSNAIVDLVLDKMFLESHGQSLDEAWYNRRHLLQFFVADRPYQIPGRHYFFPESGALEDSVYWVLSFTNSAC